jgi:hypothetical protein
MKLTVTEISVHSEKDNPIFGELVTHVKLEDEGGGLFIKLVQHTDEGTNVIKLEFNEIPHIVKAISILENKTDNSENMVGLYNMLNDEQKTSALNFEEDESFGPIEFKRHKE